MANRTISSLAALTAPAADDLLPIVDVSEALASAKNKKITYAQLVASLFGNLPSGTAASPGVAFASDVDTGLFNPAAGVLGVTTNGTVKVIFDDTAAPLKEILGGVYYPVVTQADIGTEPNQVPLNGMLGSAAFKDADYLAATTTIDVSAQNLYVDGSIGNDTTGNGSQAKPLRGYAAAVAAVTATPAIINLLSNAFFSDAITWTTKTNVTTQGNNLAVNGGTNTISGQVTFGAGSTYNHYINTTHSTGATAPFVHASGSLGKQILQNITVNTTAADWLGLNAGSRNWIRLRNIQFSTLGINAINLPAFTNQFVIWVEQQDTFLGSLLFSGAGSALAAIVIDGAVPEGQAKIPASFVGTIAWQDRAFATKLGSASRPVGLITTQADLDTILAHTANSNFDGYYAITGFTPTAGKFANGTIFGKQTAGGQTFNWWGRTIAYAPSVIADLSGKVYQLNAAGTWAAVEGGVTSFSGGGTGLTPATASTGAIVLGGTLNVANGGTGANTLAKATIATQGYTTTATATGTTTLTVASTQLQFFTGTLGQIVALPVVSTLTLGQRFEIHNNSTGVITVNSSGGNLVAAVAANTTQVFTCTLITGATAASWDALLINMPAGGITPIFYANTNANQTFATNQSVKIVNFGTVVTDNVGGFSTATNKYTVVTTGYYQVAASLQTNANTSSTIQLYKNNTVLISLSNNIAGQVMSPGNPSPPLLFNAGDVLELYMYSNGGETTFAGNGCRWSIVMINTPLGVMSATVNAQNDPTFADNSPSSVSADWVNGAKKTVYSTTETATGNTWIDGKPIYRKVVPFTNATANAATTIDATLKNTYISTLLGAMGSGNFGGTIFTIPTPNSTSFAYQANLYSSNLGLRMELGSSMGSVNSGNVIVEYTKI